MRREPVEERGRQLLIARDRHHPFRKRRFVVTTDGASLVVIGDQIEEELAADPLEGDEAKLVDEEYLDAPQPLLEARELTGVAGLEELAHEIGAAARAAGAFVVFGGIHATLCPEEALDLAAPMPS